MTRFLPSTFDLRPKSSGATRTLGRFLVRAPSAPHHRANMEVPRFDALLLTNASLATPGLVAFARNGYCRGTKDFSAGNCATGDQGTWPLQGKTPLASCLQRCTVECARCRFVSFSVNNAECSWYYECDVERLQTRHSRGHQTIAVTSHWAALESHVAPAPRPEPKPICAETGKNCVRVVAYDTENTDMYPPVHGAAGMPIPFAVHFVHPPTSLAANASMTEKLHHKFKAFQAFAATAPAEHVLFFIDARDVVWGGCPMASLGERFDSLNRSVVFGAELGCFPIDQYCEHFPPAPALPRRLVDCDFTCSDPPAYRHLNSGFIAARASDARAFFELYAAEFARRKHLPANPDQAISSELFVRHHSTLRYGLDLEGRLSLQLHRMKRQSLLVSSDGSVRSRLLGGEPACFLHFNGGSKFMQTLLRRPGRATVSGGPVVRRRISASKHGGRHRQLPVREPRGARNARIGHCGSAVGAGDCLEGSKGSWALAASEVGNLDDAQLACHKRCEACARCRYISYSVQWKDCTWHRLCDLKALWRDVPGFQSIAVRPAAFRKLAAFRAGQQAKAGKNAAKAAAEEFAFVGDASRDALPQRSAASRALWRCRPSTSVKLAVGVMTAMGRHRRRDELRHIWPPRTGVAACFVVSRWRKDSTVGELRLDAVTATDASDSDVLVLDANSSEIEGGTAAFKMLPWIGHALAAFPNVQQIARADDDVYLELPALVDALQAMAAAQRASTFLFGDIHQRAWWGPSTRKVHLYAPPSDARGPFKFANGQFFAVSVPTARALHSCRSAHDYVFDMLNLRRGPFVMTADDGLLGYLLHACLPYGSLHTFGLRANESHDIRCHKDNGFGRPPSDASLVIHKLKTDGSICYARCTRAGSPGALLAKCCTKFVCAAHSWSNPRQPAGDSLRQLCASRSIH